MKKSQYKRGDFIKAKMGLYILYDLGKGKITADPRNTKKPQAGDIEDLMRKIETSGFTENLELAKHEYYQLAIEAWRRCQEAKRQRFIESRGM